MRRKKLIVTTHPRPEAHVLCAAMREPGTPRKIVFTFLQQKVLIYLNANAITIRTERTMLADVAKVCGSIYN
jgi:hypothetical protein